MSTLPQPAPITADATRGWIVPLVRAAVAIALGLVITFSPDHSASFGLVTFGAFAIATGAVQGAASIAARRSGRAASLASLQAAVTLLAGVVALAVLPNAGVGVLVGVVSAWAVLAGALELAEGLLARRRGLPARDALTLGGLALLLALVLPLVPPDYRQPWQVTNSAGVIEASGAVTVSIMVVGIVGAWAIIHGVLLAIGAVSARRSVAPEELPR